MEALRYAISLVPVVAFLAALLLIDSYQLVPFRAALRSVAAGVLAGVLCLAINVTLMDVLNVPPSVFARTAAPLIEEIVKASWVVWLLRRHRLGFTVDAAIHGFAVGAGFALFENVYYLRALEDPAFGIWIARGFGTAVLHGSTSAIFAMGAKSLSERHPRARWTLLPGFGLATGLHFAFNQVVLPPLISTAVILAVFPLAVGWVFRRSEGRTREWLGAGFDADLEILEVIESGEFRESPIGRYLRSLRDHFPPTVVADMFCTLQIHHELAIRAKTLLLAREVGVEIPIDDGVRDRLRELTFLRESVGPTGRLALRPLLSQRGRAQWQLQLLEGK